MARRKRTVPSCCNMGLWGGAGASGTGAADPGGLVFTWALAEQSHPAQHNIEIISGREKTTCEKDLASRCKGCDIRHLPDGIFALHSLQGCQSCRIAKSKLPQQTACIGPSRPPLFRLMQAPSDSGETGTLDFLVGWALRPRQCATSLRTRTTPTYKKPK